MAAYAISPDAGSVLRSPVAPTVPLPDQPTGVPWPTAAWPEAIDPDLQALVDAGFELSEDEVGLHLALVAVQGGRIVAERYGATAAVDTELISWSMAKSVLQALVGIAAADGLVDVHAPAPVPEWQDADDPRRSITVEQLLRMASGLEFHEDYVDDQTSHCIAMLFGEGESDMAAYAASLPRIADADTVFNYSSGTTNIISRLLADQVGRGDDFDAWARSVLFDRIGMAADLRFDGAGTWIGSSFLFTTARDFARFGLLYARDGVWDEQRLLPDGWVDRARTVQAIDDENGRGYGSHWWSWDTDRGVFFAGGYECQRIIVDPAADVVLVRLGKTPIEIAPNVDAWINDLLTHLRTTGGG